MNHGEYHGWVVLTHPHFEDQYAKWKTQVQKLKSKKPESYLQSDVTKRFAALDRLAFSIIPQNPEDQRFLIGNTLGERNRAWRRAKFGQQYRLFFRFDSRSKVIILGWVNDSDSLRAYGAKDDAYLVFAKLLEDGNPPSAWNELIDQSL